MKLMLYFVGRQSVDKEDVLTVVLLHVLQMIVLRLETAATMLQPRRHC